MKITSKILTFALAAILLIGGVSVPASAAALTAAPTSSIVYVNGQAVAFDAYNISGNNYFKLRDLAYTFSGTAAQFDVGWDGANNAIIIDTDEDSAGGEDGKAGELDAISLLSSFAKNELPGVTLDDDIEDMSKPGTRVGYDNLICSYIIRQADGESAVLACLYSYTDENGVKQVYFTLYEAEGGSVSYFAFYNNVKLKYVTAQNDIVVVDGVFYLAERNIFYDVAGTGKIAQETLKISTIAEPSEKFYLHSTDKGAHYETEYRENGQTINDGSNIALEYYGLFDSGLVTAARNGQPYMSAENIGDRLYLLDLSK